MASTSTLIVMVAVIALAVLIVWGMIRLSEYMQDRDEACAPTTRRVVADALFGRPYPPLHEIEALPQDVLTPTKVQYHIDRIHRALAHQTDPARRDELNGWLNYYEDVAAQQAEDAATADTAERQ